MATTGACDKRQNRVTFVEVNLPRPSVELVSGVDSVAVFVWFVVLGRED